MYLFFSNYNRKLYKIWVLRVQMAFTIKTSPESVSLEDFRGHPRISSWIPKYSDILKIVDYIRIVNNPRVLDAGCGNGFLSNLLALEGLNVKGIDTRLEEDSQILYSRNSRLKLKKGNLWDAKHYKGINVIFNSWMGQGQDFSGCFIYASPEKSMIIYVRSPSTGLQPSMPIAMNPSGLDTYMARGNFREIDRWPTYGTDGLAIAGRKDSYPTMTNEVIIQVQKDFYELNKEKFERVLRTVHEPKIYNWEKDLSPNT